MPNLENTLGKEYSAGGPQVLARFRSPPLAAQPLVRAVTATVGAADGEHILDTGFGPGVSLRLLARPARA